MPQNATQSSLNTSHSEMEKQKRARFALLARVGHLKKEASQLHDEADFYSTTATELLAHSMESLLLLESLEERHPEIRKELISLTSKHIQSVKRLLSFWPQNTKSQSRFYKLLDSAGVEMATDISPEGYVSPSMDLTLKNVARAIGATRRE